jgi:hypothetical protein
VIHGGEAPASIGGSRPAGPGDDDDVRVIAGGSDDTLVRLRWGAVHETV